MSVTAAAVMVTGAPSPLHEIRIGFMIKQFGDLYTYKYSIQNPKSNDGKIWSIDLFLGIDSSRDKELSSQALRQCQLYLNVVSEKALKERPMVPVGSQAPENWTWGYGILDGFSDGAYGWGAMSDPYFIKPGSSLGGFELTSYGLPGIRTVLVQPDIDTDKLPSEYEENLEKTVELENSVRWLGKTIGPKAPPKVFVASDFLQYVISLEKQAEDLGWIKRSDLERGLTSRLDKVDHELIKEHWEAVKEILRSLLSDIKSNKGRALTSEGEALLYYNIKYLNDHIVVHESGHDHSKDHHHPKGGPHHIDHDHGKRHELPRRHSG
jgi:hypothetical protein